MGLGALCSVQWASRRETLIVQYSTVFTMYGDMSYYTILLESFHSLYCTVYCMSKLKLKLNRKARMCASRRSLLLVHHTSSCTSM